MTTIHSLPSPVLVPAFGQGQAVQAPVRAELDTLDLSRLAETVLAQPAFAQAGASMQPQLRTPDGLAVDEAAMRDAFQQVLDEDIPTQDLLVRSYERNQAAAAGLAVDVASSTKLLAAGDITFDPFFRVVAAWADTFQVMRAASRDLGTKQAEISLQATEAAAQKAVDQAVNNLVGTIAQGAIAVGLGAAAVGQSAAGAKITADSAKHTLAPKTPAPDVPASKQPTAAVGSDGVEVPSQPPLDMPDATPTISPDAVPDVPDALQAAASDVVPDAAPDALDALDVDSLLGSQDAAKAIAGANANVFNSRAQFYQQIATPLSGIGASGGQIAGAVDEGDRIRNQAAAETARQVANMQNEQASHEKELRNAAFEALKQLGRREESNARIIGNM